MKKLICTIFITLGIFGTAQSLESDKINQKYKEIITELKNNVSNCDSPKRCSDLMINSIKTLKEQNKSKIETSYSSYERNTSKPTKPTKPKPSDSEKKIREERHYSYSDKLTNEDKERIDQHFAKKSAEFKIAEKKYNEDLQKYENEQKAYKEIDKRLENLDKATRNVYQNDIFATQKIIYDRLSDDGKAKYLGNIHIKDPSKVVILENPDATPKVPLPEKATKEAIFNSDDVLLFAIDAIKNSHLSCSERSSCLAADKKRLEDLNRAFDSVNKGVKDTLEEIIIEIEALANRDKKSFISPDAIIDQFEKSGYTSSLSLINPLMMDWEKLKPVGKTTQQDPRITNLEEIRQKYIKPKREVEKLKEERKKIAEKEIETKKAEELQGGIPKELSEEQLKTESDKKIIEAFETLKNATESCSSAEKCYEAMKETLDDLEMKIKTQEYTKSYKTIEKKPTLKSIQEIRNEYKNKNRYDTTKSQSAEEKARTEKKILSDYQNAKKKYSEELKQYNDLQKKEQLTKTSEKLKETLQNLKTAYEKAHKNDFFPTQMVIYSHLSPKGQLDFKRNVRVNDPSRIIVYDNPKSSNKKRLPDDIMKNAKISTDDILLFAINDIDQAHKNCRDRENCLKNDEVRLEKIKNIFSEDNTEYTKLLNIIDEINDESSTNKDSFIQPFNFIMAFLEHTKTRKPLNIENIMTTKWNKIKNERPTRVTRRYPLVTNEKELQQQYNKGKRDQRSEKRIFHSTGSDKDKGKSKDKSNTIRDLATGFVGGIAGGFAGGKVGEMISPKSSSKSSKPTTPTYPTKPSYNSRSRDSRSSNDSYSSDSRSYNSSRY